MGEIHALTACALFLFMRHTMLSLARFSLSVWITQIALPDRSIRHCWVHWIDFVWRSSVTNGIPLDEPRPRIDYLEATRRVLSLNFPMWLRTRSCFHADGSGRALCAYTVVHTVWCRWLHVLAPMCELSCWHLCARPRAWVLKRMAWCGWLDILAPMHVLLYMWLNVGALYARPHALGSK